VIVHRAILGSCERLLAILIEHYAGKWPFWVSPRQALICTVSDNFNEFAEKVQKRLSYEGFQVNLDKGGHTLQKKIVLAEKEEYNYILVIGKEEMESDSVDVRTRERERLGKFSIEKLIEFFKSLEPPKSQQELNIIENMFKENKSDEADGLNERLKTKLFVNGNELTEEDLTLFNVYKDKEINIEKHPNLFKWKKLVELSSSLKN
jgi:Anticodon binding domain